MMLAIFSQAFTYKLLKTVLMCHKYQSNYLFNHYVYVSLKYKANQNLEDEATTLLQQFHLHQWTYNLLQSPLFMV